MSRYLQGTGRYQSVFNTLRKNFEKGYDPENPYQRMRTLHYPPKSLRPYPQILNAAFYLVLKGLPSEENNLDTKAWEEAVSCVLGMSWFMPNLENPKLKNAGERMKQSICRNAFPELKGRIPYSDIMKSVDTFLDCLLYSVLNAMKSEFRRSCLSVTSLIRESSPYLDLETFKKHLIFALGGVPKHQKDLSSFFKKLFLPKLRSFSLLPRKTKIEIIQSITEADFNKAFRRNRKKPDV